MAPISDFLYARPSFIEVCPYRGLQSSLNEYNISPIVTKADLDALWMDWAVVGEDLRRAMREHGEIASRR